MTTKKITKKVTSKAAKKATPVKKTIKKTVKKSAVLEQKITPFVLPNLSYLEFQPILEKLGACRSGQLNLSTKSIKDIYREKSLGRLGWFFYRLAFMSSELSKLESFAFGGSSYATKVWREAEKAEKMTYEATKNWNKGQVARLKTFLKYYTVEKETKSAR